MNAKSVFGVISLALSLSLASCEVPSEDEVFHPIGIDAQGIELTEMPSNAFILTEEVCPEGMEFSLQGNDKYADLAYVNSVEVNGSFGQAIENGEEPYYVYFVGEWGEVFNSVETNPVTMKFCIKPNGTGKDRMFFVEIGSGYWVRSLQLVQPTQ